MSVSAIDADYNVGQNIAISIVRNKTGETFVADDLGLVMKFKAQGKDEEKEINPLSTNGEPIFRVIPKGWHGSIQFARMNGSLTALCNGITNSFYGAFGKSEKFTMRVRITNPNNSTDGYTFSGMVLLNFDFGEFEANKEVLQGFEFRASRCE